MNRLVCSQVAAVVLLSGGCATSGLRFAALEVPVTGRGVEVVPKDPKALAPAQGELIVATPERILVLTDGEVREFPSAQVDQVLVRRHSVTARQVLGWLAAGAAATAVVLVASCLSVEGNGAGQCAYQGGVFPGITYAAIGVGSAFSIGASRNAEIHGSDWKRLRAYARFPQGLPPAVDVQSLSPVGSLWLQVDPPAEVELDGQSLGTTPLQPLLLRAGQHRLLFRHASHPTLEQVIWVKAGDALKLQVDLAGRSTASKR